MASLLVAAGGGGDALAALVVHQLLGEPDPPAAVMTFAWERLRVDPVPGPRSIADFRGLTSLGRHNALITAGARPIPPSGSTLPRLSAEIGDVPLLLLDPSRGAVGLRQQVQEAVDLLEVDAVHVVDVGGDILAIGDESDLRSPLADTLALCGCSCVDVAVDVIVSGPGLDGELSADHVRRRIAELEGVTVGRVEKSDVAQALAILKWHPSEATALLVAAATGRLGTIELRDAGTPLVLDEGSAEVFRVSAEAVAAASLLAPHLCQTASLREAENAVRAICGSSEIDYERRKQDRPASQTEGSSGLQVEHVDHFLREARSRHVDYVTLRRLAEGVHASTTDVETMRQLLRDHSISHDAMPLWSTRPLDSIPAQRP